jgi:hypothetical protein
MKMVKEDFVSISQVIKDSEVFFRKITENVIKTWKEKGMYFANTSIVEVNNNTVLISCMSREYLIDFNLCYLSVPLNKELNRSTPFIVIKFFKCPKNKFFKNEGIIQIGEKYYINRHYLLLDKNQEEIKSDLFETYELLANAFFEEVAKDIQMAE